MLTVYKFGPIGDSPDMSPFVIKLETWLRMANVPYATELGGRGRKPLGKLPTVLVDDKLIADSGFIIKYLERKFSDPLGEERLDREDKTLREAMKALFETGLYWVGFCIRWGINENFEHYKPAMRNYALQTSSRIEGFLLKLIEPIAFSVVRKQSLRQAQAQGTGRHTQDEIVAMGVEWWGVVSEHLGNRPYMLGHGPTALDATAYGFLDSYLGAGVFKSPVHDFIASRANLVSYWKRLREQYWSDLNPSAMTQQHPSATG
jgi:glutathione S-transferase